LSGAGAHQSINLPGQMGAAVLDPQQGQIEIAKLNIPGALGRWFDIG
jgi:hypothetical protein